MVDVYAGANSTNPRNLLFKEGHFISSGVRGIRISEVALLSMSIGRTGESIDSPVDEKSAVHAFVGRAVQVIADYIEERAS